MQSKITKSKRPNYTSTESRINLNIFTKPFIFSILVIIIFSSWTYYTLSFRLAKIEDIQILAQLKTIILLPDVTPTMALVTDSNILKKQQPTFFADVKNGDRLIIYPDLAIIYDYEANKIIKIGSIQSSTVTP